MHHAIASSTGVTRVTINDVARAVGLAKGTVSRALNGYPDIAESTRLRVTRTAERMGYRPLAQAQAIRTGRARSLGLVLNTGSHDAHKPFLLDFLDGISRAVSGESWTLSVAIATGLDEELATMRRLIDERKVDGFILPRAMREDARVALCRDLSVPFILFGRTGEPEDCAWFDVLGEDAIHAAVLRLASFGHRRIGFINGSFTYNYAHLRHAAYLSAMAEAGLTPDPATMVAEVLSIDQGDAAGRAILAAEKPPTGVVCATDLAALGLYRAADAMGRRVGEDLAVISYDGLPEAASATPPLTTYSVDTRAAGRRLAQMLIARIRGAEPEKLRELAPAMLIERASDRLPHFAPGGVHRPDFDPAAATRGG